jgi:hypothetical protein
MFAASSSDGTKRKAAEMRAPSVPGANRVDYRAPGNLGWDGGSATQKRITIDGQDHQAKALVNVMVIFNDVDPALTLTKAECQRLEYVNMNTIYAQGGSIYREWNTSTTKFAESCFILVDGDDGRQIEAGQLLSGSKKKCLITLPRTSTGPTVDPETLLDEDHLHYAIFPRIDGARGFAHGDKDLGNGCKSFFRIVNVAVSDDLDKDGQPKLYDLRVSYDFIHAVCVKAVWLWERENMYLKHPDTLFFCYPNHLTTPEYYTKYRAIYRLAFGEHVNRLVGLSESDATILGAVQRHDLDAGDMAIVSIDFGGAWTLMQRAHVEISDGCKKVKMIKKICLPIGQQSLLCRIFEQAISGLRFTHSRDMGMTAMERLEQQPQTFEQLLAMMALELTNNVYEYWTNAVDEFVSGRVVQPCSTGMGTRAGSKGMRFVLDVVKTINCIAQFISHVLITAECETLFQSRLPIKIVPVGTVVWTRWFRDIFTVIVREVMGARRYVLEFPPNAGGRERSGAAGTMDGIRAMAKIVNGDGDIKLVPRHTPVTLVYTDPHGRGKTEAFDSESNAVTLPKGISFITIKMPEDRRQVKETVGKAQGYTEHPTNVTHWAEFVRETRNPQVPYTLDTTDYRHHSTHADTLILTIKGGGRIEDVVFQHDHVTLTWGNGKAKEVIPLHDDRVIIVSSGADHMWLRLYNKLDQVAGLCGDLAKAKMIRRAFHNLFLHSEVNIYNRITDFMAYYALEAYPDPEHWEPFTKPTDLKFGYNPHRDDEAAMRYAFPKDNPTAPNPMDQYEEWMLMSAVLDINTMYE